jgi:hypothetical protein
MTKDFTQDVVFDSLKRSVKGSTWKWFLGSDGSLFAILLFGKNFLKENDVYTTVMIGVYILSSIFLLRLLLIFLMNLAKYLHYNYKESVYGDAIITLKDSFSKVHSLRRIETIEDKEFMETMIVFCNNLQIIFNKKTKRTCSVSIKVPSKGNMNASTVVNNLCRDSIASKTRDTDIYRDTKHTIIGNTAYQKIVNNLLTERKNNLFYLNNDINSSKDYENTSRSAYNGGILPYSSELVCPIIPQIWDKTGNNYDCLGFICIDCDSRNVFDDKYDVAIIAGVADGIYDLITLRNIKNQ